MQSWKLYFSFSILDNLSLNLWIQVVNSWNILEHTDNSEYLKNLHNMSIWMSSPKSTFELYINTYWHFSKSSACPSEQVNLKINLFVSKIHSSQTSGQVLKYSLCWYNFRQNNIKRYKSIVLGNYFRNLKSKKNLSSIPLAPDNSTNYLSVNWRQTVPRTKAWYAEISLFNWVFSQWKDFHLIR